MGPVATIGRRLPRHNVTINDFREPSRQQEGSIALSTPNQWGAHPGNFRPHRDSFYCGRYLNRRVYESRNVKSVGGAWRNVDLVRNRGVDVERRSWGEDIADEHQDLQEASICVL